VRAKKPLLSPWSAKWSFTTGLESETLAAPIPESPEDGAIDIPIQPLFLWSAVDRADDYELMVSGNPDFSDSVINKTGDYALPLNFCQSDISLLYGATYYWQVRAVNSGAGSAWSEVAVFTIEQEAASEPEQTSEPGSTPVLEPATLTAPTIKPEITLTPEPAMNPQPPPDTTGKTQTVIYVADTDLPPSPQPPPTQSASDGNDRIYYIIGGMGSVIALMMITTIVLAVKRRHIL